MGQIAHCHTNPRLSVREIQKSSQNTPKRKKMPCVRPHQVAVRAQQGFPPGEFLFRTKCTNAKDEFFLRFVSPVTVTLFA